MVPREVAKDLSLIRLSTRRNTRKVDEIMTRGPITVKETSLAADVLRTLTAGERKLTQVFVCNEAGEPTGLIHMHMLLKAGLS